MAQAIPATIGGQQVLILKEGASRTVGREVQQNNIEAVMVIAEILKTSLGPQGMDKILLSGHGDATITGDGATILKEMDVEHPVAKMMSEIAKATDQEVGDGTTSVVIVTGGLLERALGLIEQGVHPTLIIDGYREAGEHALKILDDISTKISPQDRDMLKKIAATASATRMLQGNEDFLAGLVVDAVLKIAKRAGEGYQVDLDDIAIEKKSGQSILDTRLIEGVAVNKEIVNPGMPKRIENARILLVSSPFQVEKTEFEGRIRIEKPEEMEKWLDEEEKLLRGMVDQAVASGANVVLCQKAIEDSAQHYMAQKGIMAVRQLTEKNMEKLSKATGGKILSSLKSISQGDLGFARVVEERKMGNEDWVFVEGCKNPKAVSILIRGGTEKATEEAERAIHDALFVVKDVVENPKVLAGGGAPEAEVALRLREYADMKMGKDQLAIQAFADAIEEIPLTLASNSGLDPLDIQTELRAKHKAGLCYTGVESHTRKIKDMREANVYEPLSVKIQILKSALEASSMILGVDDVVAVSKMGAPGMSQPPM